RLLARLGNPAAIDSALNLALDPHMPLANRLANLQALGEAGASRCVPALFGLFDGNTPEGIQLAALDALQHFGHSPIAASLLRLYPKMTGRVLDRTCTILLSRSTWARTLLEAVDRGGLPAKVIPVERLRPIALFQDRELDALVRKHWGSLQSGTPEEKLA